MVQAGQRILAADFPPAVSVAEGTAQNNVSSTTPIAGSPAANVTFTAPTSGAVLMHISGWGSDNGGANSMFLDREVRLTNSSGTIVSATGNALYYLQWRGATSSNNESMSKASVLAGLTPGQLYWAELRHYVSGGSTFDLFLRGLIIQPLVTA